MTKQQLAVQVFSLAHRTGEFKLRSGQTSKEYFDKYRFESQPQILQEIAKHMLPLIPKNIDYLAALEMGGIPIGTALSLASGLPCVFVRKQAKDYGTCQFAEGLEIQGKRLCIVEDVITTGGQVLISAEDLRGQGAMVENVLCVIDRGADSKTKMTQAGLCLQSLFTMEELKSVSTKV